MLEAQANWRAYASMWNSPTAGCILLRKVCMNLKLESTYSNHVQAVKVSIQLDSTWTALESVAILYVPACSRSKALVAEPCMTRIQTNTILRKVALADRPPLRSLTVCRGSFYLTRQEFSIQFRAWYEHQST